MKTKPFIPRTRGTYGQTAVPFVTGGTVIESETLCTDYGRFERRGVVRHEKTSALVDVRLDVADTYFSIPATTARESGFVTVRDFGEYGADLVFVPHTAQNQTPAEYRRSVRAAYK